MEKIMTDKNTFYNMLKTNAESRPDAVAVVYDTMKVTYAKLFDDVTKKALHFQKFDGERIAIFGQASYRWIVNMFGTIVAGKDLVLVDFFLPHDSRVDLLKKTDVNYTLTSTNQYILSDENSIIISSAEKDDVEGLIYDENTTEGDIIMFTATAGECDKPVVLSVDNILNTAREISSRVECTEDDIVLAQISLHNEFGFIYSLIWPLCCGAMVCIGRGLRHIDADTYYYNPTILIGTPSMIDYLRSVSGFNRELNTIIIGGASCPFRLFENLCDNDLKVLLKSNLALFNLKKLNLSKNKLTEKILDILVEKEFEGHFNKLKILNLSGNLLQIIKAENYQNFFEKFKTLKSFIVKHTPFELSINNYTRTIINRHYENERKKKYETQFTKEDLEIQKILENNNYLVEKTNVTISLIDTNNYKYVSKIKKYYPDILKRIDFETRFYDNK